MGENIECALTSCHKPATMHVVVVVPWKGRPKRRDGKPYVPTRLQDIDTATCGIVHGTVVGRILLRRSKDALALTLKGTLLAHLTPDWDGVTFEFEEGPPKYHPGNPPKESGFLTMMKTFTEGTEIEQNKGKGNG